MTVIRYSFRPSLFEKERTIVLDGQGVTADYGGTSFRTPWEKIADVHIGPVPNAGDDERQRFVVNLKTFGGAAIKIDSVNVRGAGDFEHKTDAFLAVLGMIHKELAGRDPRPSFRFGSRSSIVFGWRIALFLALAAGLFGIGAAIATEEYEAILYAGPFALFGLSGLFMLRGKRGPRAYDPTGFAEEFAKPVSPPR